MDAHEPLTDRATVLDLLREAEQILHAQPGSQLNGPRLALLEIRNNSLAFALASNPIRQNPVTFLSELRTQLTEDTDYAMRFLKQFPAIYGIGLVAPALLAPNLDADARKQLARQGVTHPLDMPGTVNCRIITMLDLDGRAYMVVREDNREPEAWDDTDPDNKISGVVPVLLSGLLYFIARAYDGSPEALSNVLKLRTRLINEMENKETGS